MSDERVEWPEPRDDPPEEPAEPWARDDDDGGKGADHGPEPEGDT